jgi:hypothetical protein
MPLLAARGPVIWPVVLVIASGLPAPVQASAHHHSQRHHSRVTRSAPSELLELRGRVNALQEQLNVRSPCGGTLRNDP